MSETTGNVQKDKYQRAVRVIKAKPPTEKRFVYRADVTDINICRALFNTRLNDLVYFKYGSDRKLFEVYQSKYVYNRSASHMCLENDRLLIGLSQVANVHFSEKTNLRLFWIGENPSVDKFYELLLQNVDCCVILERSNVASWYYDASKKPIEMLIRAYGKVEFTRHLESIRDSREETMSKMSQKRRGYLWR